MKRMEARNIPSTRQAFALPPFVDFARMRCMTRQTLFIVPALLIIGALLLNAQTPTPDHNHHVGTYALHSGFLLGESVSYRINTVTGDVWLIGSGKEPDGTPRAIMVEVLDTPQRVKEKADMDAMVSKALKDAEAFLRNQ